MQPDSAVPQERLQQLLYTISVYEQDTILTEHEKNRQFLVSHDQLAGFFRSEVTFRPEKNLLWMKADGTTTTYLLAFPKRAKPRMIFVKLNRKVCSFSLELPSLLFKVKVLDGQVSALDGWCYAGPLKQGCPLYEVPLPNIQGKDICLGGIDRTMGESITETLERIFFDTPFNNHNFYVGKEGLSFPEYHRKYSGKVPVKTLKKIGSF